MLTRAALVVALACAVGASAAPAFAEEKPAGPAAPTDGWKGGAVKNKEGAFAYCVQEARYDTGHVLAFLRAPTGEMNIGLGIPGAQLAKDAGWSVKVSVDDEKPRARNAVAAKEDAILIKLGKDEDLYRLFQTGRELTIASDADKVRFQLKGSKKALDDLKACAEKNGAGHTAAKPDLAKPPFPELLGAMLAAAGMKEIQALTFDNLPEDKRPADYAWRYGNIVGGVRERAVGKDTSFTELADAYADALVKKCPAKATVTLEKPETLPGATLRTGFVDCPTDKGTVHVALLFYLTSGSNLFTVFFHEGQEKEREVADKARDGIAEVVRRLAREEEAPVEPAKPAEGEKPAKPADEAKPAEPAKKP